MEKILDMDIDRAIEQVRAGDVDAYAGVVSYCEAQVRLTVALVIPEPYGVDDVAQEAFLVAYSKLDDYVLGTDFVLWVRRIAHNLALNERKRVVRRWAVDRKYRALLEDRLERDLRVHAVADSTALSDCVGRLTPDQRDVVDAHYWKGLRTAEVAANLRRRPDWVRTVLHRARRLVSDCLEQKGFSYGA
jgi:RNA polymerase sigma-70 factor, ECF subfamily